MKFIRYGGLSSIKQKHYKTKDKTFHNPPVKYGFFAFPYQYVEKFLLTATNKPGHITNKSKWLKDNNGNKIKCKDFYDSDFNIKQKWIKYLKYKNIKKSDIQYCMEHKKISYVTILNKPRIFEYNGLIWHHLNNINEYIIKENGSWILTTMQNYILLLKKEKHANLKELNKIDKSSIGKITDPFKGSGLTIGKDHLEVFIEKLN